VCYALGAPLRPLVVTNIYNDPVVVVSKDKKCPSVANVTLLFSIISIETFTKQCACTYLRLYCGVDVTMVANEVNKFGQIFPINRRRKYKDMG
jgi:hypothetical protein